MKKLISAILAVLIATTFAYAIIGYNRSETQKEITISPAYDSMENTNITLNAPSTATQGSTIKVSGRLIDSAGEGIADKTVWVSWFGSFDMSPAMTTNSEGRFQGEKDVPAYGKDKEVLKATFAGD